MTETRKLQCKCGETQWKVEFTPRPTHLACYCSDCQAYVNHLGQGDGYLNAAGGTELLQTVPSALRFIRGAENLRLLRLTSKGLFRWYSGCCNTPVANTLKSPGFPFVGLVLPSGAEGFGPLEAEVMTKSAKVPVKEHGFNATGFGILRRGLMAKLTGRGRSPFFDDAGKPIVAPMIVSEGR
ncbi:DUF6151 family protein [Tropicibacter sp. S64]|uniref:DUF6151 family protein n=1 Tax=Tropicibacter sp. S64 TaxID=3415122 RepID=UPI003C7C601A